MRHDFAEATRLLKYAKDMLGDRAYSCEWEDHYTLGEQIDDFVASDPEKIWEASYDPSPRRKKDRIISAVLNDLAEDWTWD